MVNKFRDLPSGRAEKIITMVAGVTEGKARNGKPYIDAVLYDKKDASGNSDRITAKMWDTSAAMFWPSEGDVIEATITAKPYNGQLSYTLETYNTEVEQTMDKTLFMKSAPFTGEQMYENILNMVHAKAKGPLVEIMDVLYVKNRKKLLTHGAAKVNHHNYTGGLLYHTMRMVGNAIMQLKVYPSLDPELLLTGTALHDIGKLVELETSAMGESEYTADGVLFGHLMIGAEMIRDVAKELNIEHLESVRMLQHLVASHHGVQEWGAIAVPAVPEALILHHLDMIDSRMDTFERESEKLEEGSLSGRVFSLGTAVYRPKKDRLTDIQEGQSGADPVFDFTTNEN